MYTSENNWYSWSYGSNPKFSRQTGNETFNTQFSKCESTIGSFKEELLNAARSTLDHSTGKITVLFSGGVDSEIMLRALLEVGADPEIIIARYENDYNIYDVSYAVTICSILGVNYKILDFNLQHFYENDAERVSDLSQIDRPRALPY
jgi:asparagine synthetase B (glutamine-hydrolysing)